VFIRFRISEKDLGSGKPKGLFAAIDDLEQAGELSSYELDHLKSLDRWFNKNLPVPTALSKSGKPHATPIALSWFKDSASGYISKMRDIAGILEEHGISVTMLYTQKPGYIVYEDDFQVAAQPFPDTPI